MLETFFNLLTHIKMYSDCFNDIKAISVKMNLKQGFLTIHSRST